MTATIRPGDAWALKQSQCAAGHRTGLADSA